MADYEVGYGKPPKNRQFGQPDGPPTGKTSAQRKAEVEAAELAALVSRDLVKAVHDLVAGAENDEAKLEHLRSDTLALLRDVQNRAHGTPKQTIEQDTTITETPKGMGAFYAATETPAGDDEGE